MEISTVANFVDDNDVNCQGVFYQLAERNAAALPAIVSRP